MFGRQHKGRGSIPYRHNLRRYFRVSDKGQGLVEYALIMALVSLVTTVSLVAVGPAVKDAYCDAIDVFDPDTALCTGDSPPPGAGPKILNVKYKPKKEKLIIKVKAPKDCTEDMIVESYGPMERQGSSQVFKLTISTSSPPPEVNIGHDNCGWTKQAVN